jgi:hypothetical protein
MGFFMSPSIQLIRLSLPIESLDSEVSVLGRGRVCQDATRSVRTNIAANTIIRWHEASQTNELIPSWHNVLHFQP